MVDGDREQGSALHRVLTATAVGSFGPRRREARRALG
jgi:hypothetical protein